MDKMERVKKIIIELLESTKRPGIDGLIKYLEDSDFFEAPASTIYHGSYAGGLAEHTLNVFNALEYHYGNLADSDFALPVISEESRIIAAICHDLCKVNTYKLGTRWTKDADNKWIEIPQYKKEPLLAMGHGGKSVFIAQQFIQLSVEEAQAIYWHMGAYDTSLYMTLNELGQTYENNLLAFLLHQADMTCTYINENTNYQ